MMRACTFSGSRIRTYGYGLMIVHDFDVWNTCRSKLGLHWWEKRDLIISSWGFCILRSDMGIIASSVLAGSPANRYLYQAQINKQAALRLSSELASRASLQYHHLVKLTAANR